jgi:hypothetical protein
MSLREKIDSGDAFDRISIVDETSQIAGENGWIARNVRDDSRPQFDQIKDRLLFGSRPRRIKQDEVDLSAAGVFIQENADRHAHQFDICHSGVPDILHGKFYGWLIVLDSDHFLESSRQWQSKESDAGIKIERMFTGSVAYCSFDQRLDQKLVSLKESMGSEIVSLARGGKCDFRITQIEVRRIE